MGSSASVCNGIYEKRQLTILVVGLDNSGKTSTSRALVGAGDGGHLNSNVETVGDVTPTVGFSKFVTTHRGITINIYDLGGSTKIREIWRNYFAEAHGVVYVIDASDQGRLGEARTSLSSLMQHSLLKGKPLLLLANKQDHANALDEIDVAEKLDLEELANDCRTPTRIEICCATQGTGKNIDPIIRIGFEWLIESILHHFEPIQRRVVEDVAMQTIIERREKEARKERIQKLKALQTSVDEKTNSVQFYEPARGVSPFRPLKEIAEEWNLPGAVADVIAASISTVSGPSSKPEDDGSSGARGSISAPVQLPYDRSSNKKSVLVRGHASSASPTGTKLNNQRTNGVKALPPLKRNLSPTPGS